MKITTTKTYDITFKYQKENDTFRFEGVTEKGKNALTKFFGWNCIAFEMEADKGYFPDGTPKDLARDLEGENDILCFYGDPEKEPSGCELEDVTDEFYDQNGGLKN